MYFCTATLQFFFWMGLPTFAPPPPAKLSPPVDRSPNPTTCLIPGPIWPTVPNCVIWNSGSTTNWPRLSTSRCEVKLLCTWPTTVNWSQTPDARGLALLMPHLYSLFREQILGSVIGASQLCVRESVTVYLHHCSSLTLNSETKRLLKAFLFGETVSPHAGARA